LVAEAAQGDLAKRRALQRADAAVRKAADATQRRDVVIRSASDAGASLRDIAEATGLPMRDLKVIVYGAK
jgi:hypothetical protein